MEKLAKREDDLNVFQEEKNSKTVEKEAINAKEIENIIDYSKDLIADEIDEDIAIIQAETVMAAAKSMENMTISTGEVKRNNLEIEATLSNISGLDDEEETSSEKGDRISFTECQLAAYFAEKTSRDARRVVVEGQDLMDTISSTIQVLQSHVRSFCEKAREASERDTDQDYELADFYHTMASKYESAVVALENRAKKLEAALNRVDESAKEGLKYAALAEEITDETLDESIRTKFSACWWTNKGRAAIIVTLKKERAALLMMRRIWINVRNDVKNEERASSVADEDSGAARLCENRDRKTKIGHALSTFLGLSLLSVTSLFDVGSDSFNAILALGLLTTGWCAVYWSHAFYKCLKPKDHEETVIEVEHKDGYLESCDKRLEIVSDHLRKYNVILNYETESDTGSLETVRVDDISE